MILLTDQFSYNRQTNTFVAEVSELRSDIKSSFELLNPKTGNAKTFRLNRIDKDGSGEDIYGWNFQTNCGIKALIIND